ncbi:SU10 major capsid protein [Alkalicoccus chagannorensis]|uniref:SU10 major capsid protein n=1 Tax=Alkalicoccus chagannorensis TaxID=427072 RepID=UPI00040C5192|nr:DUF5309 family protein [Alkalicoccus chagannorensis]
MAKVYLNELVGVQESVEDQVFLLNEHQIPILQYTGFGEPVLDVKHSWFEDSTFSFETKLKDDVAAADEEILVDDTEPFMIGHQIKIDEELLKVTGVNHTQNTLEVERGLHGTEAAAYQKGDTVEVLFREGAEGADAGESRYKARKQVSNITQIFDETISVTGTAQAVSLTGIEDLYNYEQAKKLTELSLQLEKALVNGQKYEGQGGTVRQMRGVRSFIETNVIDAGGNDLTAEILNDAIQSLFEAGALRSQTDYKIMVSPSQKRQISRMGAEHVRLERQDNTRGNVVDQLVNDFGTFDFVINKNLKDNEVFIVDMNRVKVRPLRPFTHELLSTTGDSVNGTILGEFTLELIQEQAHARIIGLEV